MNSNLYARLFIVILINCISYFIIRYILWTIVLVDVSDKKNKKDAFRKEIKSVRIDKRVNMMYLKKYVVTCKSDFTIWLTIKQIFIFIESTIECLYLLLCMFNNSTVFIYNYSQVMIFQASAILMILSLQFRYGDDRKNTKYEAMKYHRKTH